MDELNRALADHIRGHPTLQDAPPSFSAHRGKATGELLHGDKGPIRVVEVAPRHALPLERRLGDEAARLL